MHEAPTPETFVVDTENFPVTPQKGGWLTANRPDLTAEDVVKQHAAFLDDWTWRGEEFTAEVWDRKWRGWMRMAFPRLTDDWRPSAAAWAQARTVAPDVDLASELTGFVYDCVLRDRRFKDPNSAWLEWVSEAQDDIDESA